MASFNTDVFFDVTRLDSLMDPAGTDVYQRDTVDRGVFTKLFTTYNPVAKELTAKTSTFGEFLFGWADTDSAASPPILYTPLNADSVNQLLPVVFRWTPRG